MKRSIFIIAIVTVFALGALLVRSQQFGRPTSQNQNAGTPALTNATTNTNAVPAPEAIGSSNISAAANANVKAPPTLVMPLDGFDRRVTKKPFGIRITPETSPVQPEKFHGYHTGADAEVSQEEGTIDVPVYSIADGTVTLVAYLRGYGGVVMIRHVVGDETVTALYGHVRQSSVLFRVGDTVHVSDQIAVLGSGYTTETQGERKHLHFGLLKGASKDTRGYVATQKELMPWLDSVVWLKEKNAQDPRE